MKRSTGTLALLLGLFVLASPAQAVVSHVVPGGNANELAVGNGTSYWAKRGSGCDGCHIIMRTLLASGLTSPVATVPPRTEIRSIRAGADVAIFSTFRPKGLRSEVRLIRADGSVQLIASGRVSRGRHKSCGEVLTAGPVSPTGEATWQRVRFGSPGGLSCAWPDDHMKVWVTTLGRSPGSMKSHVVDRWKTDYFAYEHSAIYGPATWLAAINDRFLVTEELGGGTYEIKERATGTVHSVRATYNLFTNSLDLNESGATLTEKWIGRRSSENYASTLPALRSFGGSPRVLRPLQEYASGSVSMFCAGGIVSVIPMVTLTADEKFQFAIERRAVNGGSPQSVATPSELPHMSPVAAACSGSSLVVKLIDGNPGDSGPLTTYVFEL